MTKFVLRWIINAIAIFLAIKSYRVSTWEVWSPSSGWH